MVNNFRVSVIVPTLEEAPTIGGCLEALATQGAEEVIVSDAGSEDGTAELAARRGARVLIGSRGRGVQQNRGASEATGDLLLFLHADCRLEAGAVDEARRFFRRAPRAPAACFRMTVQARDPLFRCINAAAHLRAGVFGYPYGDQGLVIPRWAFEQVGGFPELPLMEDLYLARDLRRLGRIALLSKRIAVSPRRWRRHGVIGQSLRNWALTAAAASGIETSTLARFYPVAR